jgi:histidinol-phosphate aminotransferase
MIKPYSIGAPVPPGTRRLHLNEYRQPHSPEVLKALALSLEAFELSDYPIGNTPLAEALARYVGATPENIVVTSGCDEALRVIIDTSGHKTILMGAPSYTYVEHCARIRNLKIVSYMIGLNTSPEDHESSVRYYSEILERGCLVYLCSPNNPTGDIWKPATISSLAVDYPQSLFIIDEAYIEYADLDMQKGLMHFGAPTNNNVVIVRSMSKAFGLAALRIGYMIGTKETLDVFRVSINPKSINPMATLVAIAALASFSHYRETAAEMRKESIKITEALRQTGWYVINTPGNFYLVYAGDTENVVIKLAEMGILIRDRGSLPGLAGFVRITVGTSEDNRAVQVAFARLRLPKPPLPSQIFFTPKGTVVAIKALMKRTVKVLNETDIEFWALGGTLLGMFRHKTELIPGGMIPTDDDGDLGYRRFPNGEDPVAYTMPVFAREGLTLQRNRTDAYWQVGTNVVGERISPVHIDIFSHHFDGFQYVADDERFCYEDPTSPRADCNVRFAPDELLPLSKNNYFYDIMIPMPAKSEIVLRRALGPDFESIMRARVPGGLAEIPLSDLSPA